MGFGTGRLYHDPACSFFSIPKSIPFKKLNGAKRGGLVVIGKFSNSSHLHLIFVFIFILNFFIFVFLLY